MKNLPGPKTVSVFTGVIARVHGPENPLEYHDAKRPGGVRREYRRADQLIKIATLAVGKDVRRKHTDQVIGRVLSARVDGDAVIAELVITSASALDEIRSGVKELSIGYATTLDPDDHQVVVGVDEVSLVERGRCTSPDGPCALNPGTTPTTSAHDCGCHETTSAATTEAELAEALRWSYFTAWSGDTTPAPAITSKKDCSCERTTLPMATTPASPTTTRSRLTDALARVDATARITDEPDHEIARMLIRALGEDTAVSRNGELIGTRPPAFLVAFALGAIESSRHADKFGGAL